MRQTAYEFDAETLPDELQGTIKKYSALLKEMQHSYDGNHYLLRIKEDAASLVETYEQARDLLAELDAYGRANGIKMPEYKGYNDLTSYLSGMKDAYAEAKQLLDDYANAEARILEAFGTKGYKEMLGLPTDADVETLRKYAQEWDALINNIEDSAYDGYGKRVREALVGMMQKDFPKIYAEWLKLTEFKGADNMSKGTDKATESVKKLTEALSTATKAKQAFDAAMAQGAENEGFKNYQDAYAAYAEEMKAGRVGSRKAMAAAQYLMAGSDLYNFDALYQAGGYKAVNKAMSNMPFKTLYGGENNEYGEGFLNALSKLAKGKNGEIKLNDKVVASYKEVGEQVDFTVEDLWGLADALNISPDQVWQSIKALSVYGEVNSDVGRVKKTL